MLFLYTHDRPTKRRRPRARKNTKDLVGIVFSRVVRSSEIQVEEHHPSLPLSCTVLLSNSHPTAVSLSLSLSLSLSRFLLDSETRAERRRVQIGFCVFRQTSGPLPGQETEDKENLSALCSKADWKTRKKYGIRE